jgi:peptidoglycan hydrolase CwlO-like protein
VVLPVRPAALREAESAYDSGDYAEAARSYEVYFESAPQADDLDRSRFQFGVAQSLSGVTAGEAAGKEAFNALIRDFPHSPYVAPARMVLALNANIAQLEAEKTRLQAEQKTRDDEIGKLNTDAVARLTEIGSLQADKARLQAEQKTRDDKIKQLNEDLDKLKRIDVDKRRTP